MSEAEAEQRQQARKDREAVNRATVRPLVERLNVARKGILALRENTWSPRPPWPLST
jgi:hypothetical protein